MGKFRFLLFKLSRMSLGEHCDAVLEALANAIRKEKEIRYKRMGKKLQNHCFKDITNYLGGKKSWK